MIAADLVEEEISRSVFHALYTGEKTVIWLALGILLGIIVGREWQIRRFARGMPEAIDRAVYKVLHDKPEMFRAAADEILAERQK